MFIILCKLILTVMSEDEALVKCVTIQMKAIEQYFHALLFIILFKVVPTFKSDDETLIFDHSNERYGAVLSCGAVYLYCTRWF